MVALWWRYGGAAATGQGRHRHDPGGVLAVGRLGFHWQRYASINWATSYFTLAFVVQALLLLWLGAVRGRLTPAMATRPQQRAGLGLLLFALLIFPLRGSLLGRSWTHAEVFGMAPAPTSPATLGVLLLAGARPAWDYSRFPWTGACSAAPPCGRWNRPTLRSFRS